MIWTIIISTFLAIGVFLIVGFNYDLLFFNKIDHEAQVNFFVLGWILTFLFGVAALWMSFTFIDKNTGVDLEIERVHITQESLEKRLEIIDSDYEDVSRSQIIADVAIWNKKVISDKYWSSNPWTNWFYNDDIIAEEHIIEY